MSSSILATVPGVPPNIAKLLGPLLLGVLFNWALLGALIVQIWIYYLAFPNDRVIVKSVVTLTFIIEVVQSILIINDAFRVLATGWGDVSQITRVGMLWFSVPFISVFVSWIAQIFYAWRIRVLSQNWILPIVIVVLSLLQGACSWYTAIELKILNDFSLLQDKTYRVTSVWLGGTALCDLIIAASMIYFLHKSRTGFSRTDDIVQRLIRVTVETGLICTVVALIDLGVYVAFKDNNYHFTPVLTLSKLYSNSLLASLNSRIRFSGGRFDDPNTGDHSLSILESKNGATVRGVTVNQLATNPQLRRNGGMTGGIAVSISEETYADNLHIPMDDLGWDAKRSQMNMPSVPKTADYAA
ncbi:hypothetical protein NEOLEDRAFT_1178122 [Neolentinus lepideus HHB14362 ss-1]|uniref:DUF6534 domain-containing protein n=1 Tax=Neolentinus lepideus HHB14362 ss-1 TaxID=1314782 RepID=A0A165STE8_9AGAM|nr:hypothetical protein NEOLEDRAFT_1178122 [Neolentinus lepideus HHB14362 ss-1]